MSNYTRWYREGTVNVTNNSTVVTGKDTLWLSTGLKAGDMFSIDNMTEYEVDQVSSNTQLTLKTVYTGAAASNVKYRIIRNWTASTNADVAAQAAELLTDFAEYIDSDMKTLTGKSAYKAACDNGFVGTEAEWVDSLTAYGVAKKNGYTGTLAQWLETLTAYGVAVSNGYTGTKAQWLESLKAAGEWTEASTRLAALETDNTSSKTRLTNLETLTDNYESFKPEITAAYYVHSGDFGGWLHRQIYRGKYLGTAPTAEQMAAIKNRTFKDLYPGDYWETPINVTFPIFNGADSSNGDTWTNETEAVTLTEAQRWVIVDMNRSDYFDNIGANSSKNLVLMMFRSGGGGAGSVLNRPMNYKAKYDCGYYYSLFRTHIMPALVEALAPYYNNDICRMFTIKERVCASNQANTSMVEASDKIMLPSSEEINGHRYCVIDSGTDACYIPRGQFALFNICPNMKHQRLSQHLWTRDVDRDGHPLPSGWANFYPNYIRNATQKLSLHPFIVIGAPA